MQLNESCNNYFQLSTCEAAAWEAGNRCVLLSKDLDPSMAKATCAAALQVYIKRPPGEKFVYSETRKTDHFRLHVA